ncbi:MAG: collagenase [Gammaproteobacteria bacterium]|nr:collagenase [Gammaproteobacteria bacterium]
MNVKKSLLLLMLSSSYAHAVQEVNISHPGQLADDFSKLQIHANPYQAASDKPAKLRQAVRPPRTVSPLEFEKIQANLDAKQHGVSLDSRWTLDASKQFQSANLSQSNSKSTQNVLTAPSCTAPAQLLGLYDADLVDAVSNAQLTSCLYGLYNAGLVGTEHFSDQKILTIVNAIVDRLADFDGSDESGAAVIEKLVTYLRAMHWAEVSAGSNRVYQAQYKQQLIAAFDGYFGGDHFVTFTGNSSRNYMLRYEMLILVNSSGSPALRYLPRISQAILGYANTVDRGNNWGVGYEENGMTQLLTHYFNAVNAGGADLQLLLSEQPEIVTRLRDFVLADGLWLVGHTRQYQWNDAVSELGRMLKLGGAVAASVRPAMQHILSTYSFGGVGSQGWVNAQSMVKNFDSANCDLYGSACSFDLENTILSGHHVCSETLKVRFQQPISTENLGQICSSLSAKEAHFHETFATTAPVANDNNSDLEVVIFKSSTDYQNFAGDFFGINTNNGGMYLEGTPSDPQSQARFIAYQATWLQPAFVVWNLQHEYIHYLDGRFNQWGSFSDQPDNLVWWGEGLAEYLSQPDNNPNALAVAPTKAYDLSQLFQTTYANSNTARTYHWGYLAVRYMFERQRAEIDQPLLPTLRAAKYQISTEACSFEWGWKAKPDAIANNWSWLYDDSAWGSGYWVWTCGQPNVEQTPLPEFTPYQDILASWNTGFDSDFDQWLDCLVAGSGTCAVHYRDADLDQNNAVDKRDVDIFNQRLRSKTGLTNVLDFNKDNKVNQLDVPAMMKLCDLPRCAIAQ